MIVEWKDLTKEKYENFLDIMRNNEEIDGQDYIATVYIGKVRATMNIEKGLGGVLTLNAVVEVGDVDTGYDYTIEGNLPFSIVGIVSVANQYNFMLFQPIDVFQKTVVDKIVSYVNASNNEEFIQNMNSDKGFDWT